MCQAGSKMLAYPGAIRLQSDFKLMFVSRKVRKKKRREKHRRTPRKGVLNKPDKIVKLMYLI
jgi:hypothetical protein